MAGLGDILAGAGGATFSRPALDAYVTQGQAMAGLRTAQTEEALQNAQKARDEAEAGSQLEGALASLTGPDGKPIMQPADAHFAALQMRFTHGGAQPALQALNEAIKNRNTGILSDPTQLGTPAQTAAQQGLKGEVAPLRSVPAAYAVPAGQPAPDVQVSPVANAKMSLEDAQGLLATMKAQHPEAFRSPGMGNLSPEDIQNLHDFLVMNPGTPISRALMTPGGAGVAGAIAHDQRGGGQPNAPVPAPTGQPPVGGAGAEPPPGAAHPTLNVAPGISMQEAAAIRKDFASQTGAKQSTALNTAYLHSQLLDAVADQLGTGNFTPTNQINVMWQRLFGKAAPTNLANTMAFLGREAVRATVNSGAGTGEERELAVSPSSGVDAIHGLADNIRALLGSQAHSLDARAKRGGVDITQLMPDASAAFGISHAPAAQVNNDPVARSQAELARRAAAAAPAPAVVPPPAQP